MAEFSSVAESLGSLLPLPSVPEPLPKGLQLLTLQACFRLLWQCLPDETVIGTTAGQKDRQDGGTMRNEGTHEPWDLMCLPHSLRVKKRQRN